MLTEFFAVLNTARRQRRGGREFAVSPATLIVSGVLNGSSGALFYPPDELSRTADAWNNMPVVIGHPADRNGNPVSARRSDVPQVGTVFNARTTAGKLTGEVWLDVQLLNDAPDGPAVLAALDAGRPVEVSTGLFSDRTPVSNGVDPRTGRAYTHEVRNIRPDHLAVLTRETGACSIQDGCGLMLVANCSDPAEGYNPDWPLANVGGYRPEPMPTITDDWGSLAAHNLAANGGSREFDPSVDPLPAGGVFGTSYSAPTKPKV